MQFTTILFTTAIMATASQAYVVDLFSSKDCTGPAQSRNVYDNTCAYTQGFSSYKLTTHGGGSQMIAAYSPQNCAGKITSWECSSGVNSIRLGQCYGASNTDGGSNALSSYSNAGKCPN